MWLQYMDSTKSWESQDRREGLPSSLWAAWEKRHGVHGNFLRLMHHTAITGGTNVERFNDFLRDAGLNVNPDDQVIFNYDWAPAHRNPENPRPKTELNIVEQAISCLKAAIKADISILLTYKRGWTTGMKEETVGLRWATSTHSYFCKRCNTVSALSRPRNALAGIDLCRLRAVSRLL